MAAPAAPGAASRRRRRHAPPTERAGCFLACTAAFLSLCAAASAFGGVFNGGGAAAEDSLLAGGGARRLLQSDWDPTHTAPGYKGPLGAWGIVLWVPLTTWIFLGVAIVADEYFTPALERISAALELSADVAGATFLAAASSAPEFFTSFADTFLVNDEGGEGFGIGTIVGSAVFNILIICAVSCIPASETKRRSPRTGRFATKNEFPSVSAWKAAAESEIPGGLDLDWYPIARDSVFYVASIALLIGTVATDKPEALNRRALDDSGCVTWHESLLYILVYVSYITAMKYNAWFEAKARVFEARLFAEPGTSGGMITIEEPRDAPPPGRKTFPKLGLGNSAVLAALRGNCGGRQLKGGGELHLPVSPAQRNLSAADFAAASGEQPVSPPVQMINPLPPPPLSQTLVQDPSSTTYSEDDDDASDADDSPFWDSLFEKPTDRVAWVFFVLSLPFNVVFKLTIPAVTRRNVKDHYVVSFFMCILWIAFLSAMMVKTVSWMGSVLGIDSVVMGLVVLAAGTSVPDALGSYNEAKRGEANAAVSNALGSNVFDICAGLGVPWFVYSLAYGRCFQVPKNGIMIPAVILFFVLVFFLAILATTGMKLHASVGKAFVGLYAAFVAWNILNEFVFKLKL
ncbi:putative sodium/potassium/calcium exchanger [Diplonema papillatum]|nr:putative sodium/potassium/calcium exchanger [Diplonema papillatum]